MQRKRWLADAEIYALPRPATPTPTPGSFGPYPIGLMAGQTPQQWLWQQCVYQMALEQARIALQPSLLERDLLAVWN